MLNRWNLPVELRDLTTENPPASLWITQDSFRKKNRNYFCDLLLWKGLRLDRRYWHWKRKCICSLKYFVSKLINRRHYYFFFLFCHRNKLQSHTKEMLLNIIPSKCGHDKLRTTATYHNDRTLWMVLIRIREVPGLNLGPECGYTDWGLSWAFLSPSRQIPK
jgi:hypothetical protein